MSRRLFQWFTIVLFALCAWTAYANVLSDNSDVLTKARTMINQAAGCGDDCRLEGMHGDRGMLSTRIEYDVVKHGHFVVTCARPYVAFGDIACAITEGKLAPPSASASTKR